MVDPATVMEVDQVLRTHRVVTRGDQDITEEVTCTCGLDTALPESQFPTPIAAAIERCSAMLSDLNQPDADTLCAMVFSVAATVADFEGRSWEGPPAQEADKPNHPHHWTQVGDCQHCAYDACKECGTVNTDDKDHEECPGPPIRRESLP